MSRPAEGLRNSGLTDLLRDGGDLPLHEERLSVLTLLMLRLRTEFHFKCGSEPSQYRTIGQFALWGKARLLASHFLSFVARDVKELVRSKQDLRAWIVEMGMR